jgi:hypothetical protein
MKRLLLLALMLLVSGFAAAQKVDAALVVGGSFVSDTRGTFTVPEFPFLNANFKTSHRVFVEGTLGVRLLNAHIASLHLELPVAEIPSQSLSVTPTTISGASILVTHFNTLFITPGLRLKVLPSSGISPWVSVGGGWARYAIGDTENKGAIQYGGGLDLKTGIPFLGVRAEVRDFVTANPNFGFPSGIFIESSGLHHHNVLAGGGIVLRL